MFAVRSDGKIELILDNLNPPYHETQEREVMVARINATNPLLNLRSSGYPSFSMALLANEDTLSTFLSIYADYANAVKNNR
jgi:hypothetical protein